MTTHALAALQAEVERKDVELVELRARVAELTSNMQKLVEAAATLDAEKRAEVERLRNEVAFFNGAVPTMIQCFDTLISGLAGNEHSVKHSIKGLRDYVAKLKADAALAAQGGGRGTV
jgi:chromosome segregation ATPase